MSTESGLGCSLGIDLSAFEERSARLWGGGGGGGGGERFRDRYCNPNIPSDATIAANKDGDTLLPELSCSRRNRASIRYGPCGIACSFCSFAVSGLSNSIAFMITIWSIKVKADLPINLDISYILTIFLPLLAIYLDKSPISLPKLQRCLCFLSNLIRRRRP